ncbi:divergent PAP2 family protein [Iocasia frigidifontis]|uniref:Divergent PAP2 family protein n=1 Tax=Iocasia fonsfrigidae TaxID=2682810 RepID=A0A8A7K641_9FIRM|nr:MULTISPECIES: divergent PAP2 family protein [Halanaerobiaceae]AZO94295.1 divergent PAP2 family protein [Halocella sp. SP3-1]QTL97243.1 divergent PAP2 family protein [Iocasia fonsfrigidae]
MNILELSLLSLCTAQTLKIFTKYPFDITRILGSGGMPSSHSSFVSTLATLIGLKYGFTSDLFAVVSVFSLIIIYDAGGVRRAVGEQANLLNHLLKHLDPLQLKHGFDKELIKKDLKELVGHTPFEVLAGSLLGVSIALLYHSL